MVSFVENDFFAVQKEGIFQELKPVVGCER
jgi:hypothetical protein